MNEDPASLSRLHDLVLPPPEPWWPPQPGWLILSAAFFLFLVAYLVACFMKWQADRYRREALALLENPATAPMEWPVILKRTALAAWPRDEVAHLTGHDWLAFLDRTAGMDCFVKGSARGLEGIAFAPPSSQSDLAALKSATRDWIIHHRRDVPS